MSNKNLDSDLMKKHFDQKWIDFIDDDRGQYMDGREICYRPKHDDFLLVTNRRYIRFMISNKEQKEKLIGVSEVIDT